MAGDIESENTMRFLKIRFIFLINIQHENLMIVVNTPYLLIYI